MPKSTAKSKSKPLPTQIGSIIEAYDPELELTDLYVLVKRYPQKLSTSTYDAEPELTWVRLDDDCTYDSGVIDELDWHRI